MQAHVIRISSWSAFFTVVTLAACGPGGLSPTGPDPAGSFGGLDPGGTTGRPTTPAPSPGTGGGGPTPTPTPWDTPPVTPTPWDAPPATPTPWDTKPGCGEAPVLVAPVPGHVVRQNDPTIGCSPHPNRGHGHRIVFDWADACSATGVSGYQIYAKSVTARFPIVDNVVVDSAYTFRCCNCFVTDYNRPDWRWRVRARDANGQWGEWSEERKFSFEPCRLSDGTACNAPG